MRRALGLLAMAMWLWSCAGGATSTTPVARKKRRHHRLPAAITTQVGCRNSVYPPLPTDTAAPGPWSAGLRTIHAAGVTADVYYPAPPGSEAGATTARFNLRDYLPPELSVKVRSARLLSIMCACTRELPFDDAHGPYPVVYFFHGRGLTRAEFPTLFAHLASRGFVVVSPDLPGFHLADYFAGESAPETMQSMAALLAAVAAPTDELAFLAGHLDTRVGLVGHSLGAVVVQDLVDEHGDVAVVMGAAGLRPGKRRVPTLVMGGTSDAFAPYPGQQRGYESTAPPKRLVGVKGAGHMHFADHCTVSPEFGGWYGAAVAYGVPFAGFLLKLAEKGCADAEVPAAQAHAVILAAVTAQLEETLTCSPTAADALAELDGRADVAEYREELE
jgi:pimeloyl-ACP methyl ester carboxylesterase